MEEKKQSLFEKNPVMAKLLLIIVLMLLLLIPKSMVMDLINERKSSRDQAVLEVSDKWGHSQTLLGPVLTIPYQVFYKDSKGNLRRSVEYLRVLPEELNLAAKVDPEIRYRGIFHVVLYRLNLAAKGSFKRPNFGALGIEDKDVLWSQAFLAAGISDLRGMQEDVSILWEGQKKVFQPGTNGLLALSSGIFVPLALDRNRTSYDYSYQLKLNGSRRLSFAPTGKTTTVHMESGWNSPSFQGNFLPKERKVGEKGFTADWQVFYMSRSFPQQWRNAQVKEEDFHNASFGVDLLYPVDAYQKTTRSTKYGILYVLLTFGVFFLFEILAKLRIHPIQYLLVGFSLLLFYLLLLSLSEYLAFPLSYLAACIGTVGMITAYSSSVLWNWKRARIMGLLMALLYGDLYVLLQLEDYALLLGAVGLFVILASVMYVTRRVDWYRVGKTEVK